MQQGGHFPTVTACSPTLGYRNNWVQLWIQKQVIPNYSSLTVQCKGVSQCHRAICGSWWSWLGGICSTSTTLPSLEFIFSILTKQIQGLEISLEFNYSATVILCSRSLTWGWWWSEGGTRLFGSTWAKCVYIGSSLRVLWTRSPLWMSFPAKLMVSLYKMEPACPCQQWTAIAFVPRLCPFRFTAGCLLQNYCCSSWSWQFWDHLNIWKSALFPLIPWALFYT